MTNLEYFTAQFPDNPDLQEDDMNTAYALYHASDREKFIAGFKEYIDSIYDNSDLLEANYVDKFFKWFNEEIVTNPAAMKVLAASTWEEFDYRRSKDENCD